MAVDSMVCHWLSMKVEDDAVIHNGLGHVVGLILGVFYEDYVLLGLLDTG